MSKAERSGSDIRTGQEPRRTRRSLIHAALAALGAAVGVLLEGWPDSVLRWLTVAAAALFGALFSLTALADYLDARAAWLLQRLRPSRPLRLRRLLLAGLALVLSIAFGRSVVAIGGEAAEWASVRFAGCPAATELRMLTSAEGLTAAEALADAYTVHTAGLHHGCPSVRVHVWAAPPDRARAELSSGWQANSLATLGPRPDLWLPGASRHTLVAPAESSNGLLRAAPATPLGTTPVVLAVPADLAPEEFRSGRTTLSWAEALAALDRLGWGLARPDPNVSVTGEYATVALYASGHSEPEQLGQAARPPALTDPAGARRIEGRVADGLDRGGYPLGDAVDLLCRQRRSDLAGRAGGGGAGEPSTPVALIVTEQQLVQFNAGLPLGGRCPGTAAPAPDRALLAVYPTDTLSLDEPLFVLEWTDRTPERAARVAAFRDWLTSDAGKQALITVGLRSPGRPAGDPLRERLGALPGISYPRVRLTDRTLADARNLWQGAQRAGRVLLLLDASGSMRAAAGGGQSRFDVAVQGVIGLAGRMSARDEFGVWVFQGPARRPVALVPIGGDTAGGPSKRETVEARLATVSPGGDTPLYRAVVSGVAALGPADPGRVSALVVLTDGTDEGSGITAARMVDEARRGKVRVFVVAVGSARCGVDAIREVTRVTGGACYETDLAGLDGRLGALFDVLWVGGLD